ncbi:TPA: hypothetical protein ACF220_004256, partial [Klebsiella quasipneumoniae subsp. similipneumoniae]
RRTSLAGWEILRYADREERSIPGINLWRAGKRCAYTGRRLIISQAMAMQISVIDSTKFMVAPLHPFCTQRKF